MNLLAIFVILLTPFTAVAKPATLSIIIIDEGTFNLQLAASVNKAVEKQFAHHQNSHILVINSFWRTNKNIRQELKTKILEKAQELNGPIDFLFIATHGNHLVEHGKEQKSDFEFIGTVADQTGIGSDFDEVLNPLKGKMAPNGSVFLFSCSTMCGTDQSALMRAQHLAEYLGASEGELYGSVNPATTPIGPSTLGWRNRNTASSALIGGLMGLLPTAAAALIPNLEAGFLPALLGATMGGVFFTMNHYSYRNDIQSSLIPTAERNRGKLFRFKQKIGKWINIENQWRDLHTILPHLPKFCDSVLQSIEESKSIKTETQIRKLYHNSGDQLFGKPSA